MPRIYHHDDGYYIFKFEKEEDKNIILHKGLYTFNHKPFILKEWSDSFQFDDEVLRIIPLWVKFPQLPLTYWSSESLSKIASSVGKPLCTDGLSATQGRIAYARVLVEVDISQSLPERVTVVKPKSTTFTQYIEYDWNPNSTSLASNLVMRKLTVGRTSLQRILKWNNLSTYPRVKLN